MTLKILEDSINYTAQVISLPTIQKIVGLDNLVGVNHQGNFCLIGKDSKLDVPYLFFPAECQLSHDFLSGNNLYRDSELNQDKTQKGFFENNRRVKALKLKGVISSGFVIPLESLSYMTWRKGYILNIGDEFNELNDVVICQKYVRPQERRSGMSNPRVSKIEGIVDHKFAPQHMDTSHLMKNIDKLTLDTYISVTYKFHGTSARYFNTLVKKPLTWKDKLAKYFGVKVVTDVYDYVVGSRKCIKSVGFEELPGKNHFYNSGDLWSRVGEEYFKDKLNHGEAIYCEIIGSTYSGETIQHGYSYGLQVPKVFIYRISNINAQGIEIDLPFNQVKERASQLGISVVPELYFGTVERFFNKYIGLNDSHTFDEIFNEIFYNNLLEQPSILDNSVVEEGFVIRIDTYPKPLLYKIKSKKFLLHEGHSLDKEVVDIEQTQEA